MSTDDFDSAVAGVQDKKGSDETAQVFYERRKYPLLPEGVYRAMCIKAIIDDANPNGKFYKQGDKVIKLTWEIREEGLTMKDEDGNVMKGQDDKLLTFKVFSKPMSIGFGERTNLRKLFLKLTGYDLAQKNNGLVVKTLKKIPLSNGKFKEGFTLDFNQKVLEYMEANLDIEHQQWEDNMGETKTSAYIVNYKLTPEMKKKNYDQLPPEAKSQAMSSEEVDLESEQGPKEQQVESNSVGAIEKDKIASDPGLQDFMDKTK